MGNLIRLSFNAAKPLMPGFVLELSDLTFGLQLFVSFFIFFTSCLSPGAV